MHITRIRLCNYRSYDQLEFFPSAGLNVIVGANAAGKTNILESIYLSAVGRSHRTRRDAELINSSCRGGYAGIEIENAKGSHLIEIKLRENEAKQVFVDRQKLARIGELMGVLNVVMFSPEDLSLIKGAAQERRRFMDTELCQLRPAYFYRLQQYNAALKQRNALLKDSWPVPPSDDMLEMWDEQLAKCGCVIMKTRREFADELSTVAFDLHRRITEKREQLYTSYQPDVPFEENLEFDALREALFRSHSEDIRCGYTNRGPHRDDLSVEINGSNARTFASQGQQRTAALSLKLSELALMREIKGEAPVLLLDDVLSELDADRQCALLSSAFDCQCFLTTTQLEGLKNIPDMTVFDCGGGKLVRRES